MVESEAIVEQATLAPIRKKTSFAGDVLKLVSGTVFAQVLSIVAVPLLTRLYAPEAFGVSALFSSIIGIIGVVACMRYELSIMLPESDKEAANLLGVSLGLAVLVSGFTVPIIWLGRQPLLHALGAPELGPYLWLAPPAVLVGGVFLALNYWNSRTKHFGRLSIARVTSSVVGTGTQLGAGYAGRATGGSLIIAGVIGSMASTLVLAGQIWRDDGPFFRRSIHWREMVLGLKRHRKFPLYDTFAALLNNISWQLPAFLLSAFFSSTVVGYYALGNRLLRLPMSLIGGAIAQVFFQRAAEAKVHGALSVVVESVFRRLVALGMFPFLLLTIIGRDLFVVAFGERWAEAGVYTQILAVWTFFWFISSPLTTLFRVLEKQEFSLALNIVILTTRFIALGIGGFLGDARIALLLFAISGVLVYGYLSLAIVAAAGVSWSKMIRILLANLVLFIPAGSILLTLKLLDVNSWIQVGAACAVLGIYLLYVARSDPQIRSLFTRIGITRKLVGSVNR